MWLYVYTSRLPNSAQFYTDNSGMDLISPNKNDLPKISRYGAYTIYHMTYIYMYIFYTLISDHSNHKSPPPLFFFFCLNFHRWYFLQPGLVLSIVWFFRPPPPPHTHTKRGGGAWTTNRTIKRGRLLSGFRLMIVGRDHRLSFSLPLHFTGWPKDLCQLQAACENSKVGEATGCQSAIYTNLLKIILSITVGSHFLYST